jgi:hypothetical protein
MSSKDVPLSMKLAMTPYTPTNFKNIMFNGVPFCLQVFHWWFKHPIWFMQIKDLPTHSQMHQLVHCLCMGFEKLQESYDRIDILLLG